MREGSALSNVSVNFKSRNFRPPSSFSFILITDQMPEVNFSYHCDTQVSPAYPYLFKCPGIEEGIKSCQQKGKKVLISLGGATGQNEPQDSQASILAKNLWNLFLGGKETPDIRPFGRLEKILHFHRISESIIRCLGYLFKI